jgi:hypothetical protein
MNLLKETIEDLNAYGKTPADVLWVGTTGIKTTWDAFAAVAQNADYDCGYGAQKVAENLLIVGRDFWLERQEYDGSERWEFKSLPICKASEDSEIKAYTIAQAEESGNTDISCGWESLERLNGIKEDY